VSQVCSHKARRGGANLKPNSNPNPNPNPISNPHPHPHPYPNPSPNPLFAPGAAWRRAARALVDGGRLSIAVLGGIGIMAGSNPNSNPTVS
jgi:hypothetical protein